jgi:cytidyltransferase-related domain
MIALTIGTFDQIHPGHLELIAATRYLVGATGEVWVGVNRDEFVTRYKGRPPIFSLASRVEMLKALADVDHVFVNVGDENSGLLIDAVRPDIITIGDDWLDPDGSEERYFAQLGVTAEWMQERDLRVQYVPRTRGVSSSALRVVQ